MASKQKPNDSGQLVGQAEAPEQDHNALLNQHVAIFRPLLELSPDPTVIYDSIGQVVYVNPAFGNTFGWTEAELVGKRLDFVPEELQAQTATALATLFKNGRSTGFTTKRLTKDGRVLDVQNSAILLKSPTDAAFSSADAAFSSADAALGSADAALGSADAALGSADAVFGSVITIRDITAQKETERTLRASETRYREMLESTPDAYYEVDLKGAITYYSNGLAEVLGYPEEELLGLSNQDYADPQNAHIIYEAFNQVYHTGQPAKAILMHTIRKDGQPQILETSIALRHDEAGNVVGFRGIARDTTSLITERQEAQEASARSEEKYREILETIKDGFYEVDLAGSFTFMNEQALAIFGYPSDAFLGMNYRLYTTPESVEHVYETFNQVFHTGESIDGFNHPIITASGEIRHIEVSISLAKNAEGQSTGFRGIVRNVTERIQAEESLRQSEERYRTIMEGIEDGYYEADLEGSFTYMNDQLCTVIGYPREELMGMNYQAYTTPETAARVFTTFNRVLNTGEPVKGFVWEAIGKDGRVRHLETFVLLRRDVNDNPIGFRGVGRDVTQRIQGEEALADALGDQERNAFQLATVAKISTAVSTILDPQEMVQAVVDQIQENFNLYHAHIYLLNQTGDTLELTAGSGSVGRQMVAEGRQIPLSTEQSLVARAARNRSGVIVNNVKADPGFLPHPLLPHTHAEMAVPMIVGNRVLGVVDVQADEENRFSQRHINIQTTLATQIAVTLQNARLYAQAQQQTAELQETTALLDQVIEILPVGLFMKESQNLRFVRWNKANEEITGLNVADVIDKNDYDLFAKEQADFFTEKDRQVLKGGTIIDIPEETIDTAHQGQRMLHTRKLPIVGTDGKPRFLLGLSEDITERKQAEELLQASLKMQQVLHEIGLELARVESLDELFKQTIILGNSHLRFERIGLFMYNKMTNYFVGTYGRDLVGNLRDEKSIAFTFPEEDFKLRFGDVRRTVYVEHDVPLDDADVFIGRGWHLTVPIRKNEELIGAFFAQEPLNSRRPLMGYEPQLLASYGATLTNLMERLQNELDVQESLRMQQLLHDVNLELSQAETLEALCKQAVLWGYEHLNFERLGLYFFDAAAHQFNGTFGVNRQGQIVDERASNFAITEENYAAQFGDVRQRIFVNHHTDLYDAGGVVGQGWHLAAPLRQGERFIGVLFADNLNSQRPLKLFEPDLLASYSSIIANLIERKQNEIVTQESLRVQQLLHEINLELSQAETVDDLFNQAVYLGEARLSLERFALFIYNEDRDIFSGTYGIDKEGNLRDEHSPEFEITLPHLVEHFHNIKQRILIEEDDLWDHGAIAGRGWRVTAPVRQHNKLAGLLFTDNLISQQTLPVYLPDLIVAYSNIIANLMERKQAEEAVAAALAESERLYEMSAQLNAAASISGILEAAVVPIAGQGLAAANLFTLEMDANGRPEWMEMATNWVKPGSLLGGMDVPLGSRFYLPDIPSASQWIDNPHEIWLYGDVDHDDRLDALTRNLYQMVGVKAGANLPLRAGNRWVGLITLSWDSTQTFTDDDLRLYHSLADQAAIIMNNQLLFDQTQKRASELATVAEVGAAITTIRNVDELLQRVVDLAKEQFGLYHAHIYLLDESERNLVLTSGAGEVGRQMVAEGRMITLNQAQSLIARAVRLRQGVIVNDVTADADFLPHPLLPHTKSEMAVPMIVANNVLGVLDIQSNHSNWFSEEDIQIQTTLAAQIGVALQNARSFARSEAALKELEEVTRRLRREGWESYVQTSGMSGMSYAYDQKEVKALTLAVPTAVRSKKKELPLTPTLSHQLWVQGESIGRLMLAEPTTLNDDAQDIMTAVAERLSAHIENLRLSEQTEQARRQAEQLFQGSTALNTAQSYEAVLTALRENSILGHASTNNVSLNYFDQPWDSQHKPNWVDVLTSWSRLPEEAVSSRYDLDNFPSANTLLRPDALTIIEDVAKDKRLDKNLRALYKERFQAQSTIFAPLVIGAQWVGYINAIFVDRMSFPEDEMRRLTTLSQQAAVTIQSIRLFDQAQARAERERQVRTITDKIRRGTNREEMLRVAREEISQMLGASESVVRLGTENRLLTIPHEADGRHDHTERE